MTQKRRYSLTAKRKYHGLSGTPEHKTWIALKRRCLDEMDATYADYGGRGIKVHPEWVRSFLAFLEHIGPKPSRKHSIDRIDVNGHYEPGNVRWATAQEQAENTRVVSRLTVNGRTQTLSAWSREMGFSQSLIPLRLKLGWSLEDAVLTPKGAVRHKWKERDYAEAKSRRPRSDAFMVTIEGREIPLQTVVRAYGADQDLVYGRLTKHQPPWPIVHALFAPRRIHLRAWLKQAAIPADYPSRIFESSPLGPQARDTTPSEEA